MHRHADHRLEMIQQHRAREIRDADRFRQALTARRATSSLPSLPSWVSGYGEAFAGFLVALGGRARNNGWLSRT